MKNDVINYKQFAIYTEEGTKKGIFFRRPIQKVEFDAYYGNSKFDAWEYYHKIKKPMRRFYEYLIGNRKTIRDITEIVETVRTDCWAGFTANILCSPIYFKRDYRKLIALSTDKNTNIQSIHSYGYESAFNTCAGYCECEKTSIKLKNGKTLKFKEYVQYHYTYWHTIKQIINGDKITQ